MYKTQWNDVKREVAIVNRKFFRLPESRLNIRIKKTKDIWAEAYADMDTGITTFNLWYPSYKFFRNIVGHEMIHQWQYYNGYYENVHDHTFFSWKSAMENFGYEISSRY